MTAPRWTPRLARVLDEIQWCVLGDHVIWTDDLICRRSRHDFVLIIFVSRIGSAYHEKHSNHTLLCGFSRSGLPAWSGDNGPKGCEHGQASGPHSSSNGVEKEFASSGHSTHGDIHWVSSDDEDIQIMMLEGDDFEGDTVIVHLEAKRSWCATGRKLRSVEMNEGLYEDMTKRVNVVRTEGPGGDIRVEKKVVIIQED